MVDRYSGGRGGGSGFSGGLLALALMGCAATASAQETREAFAKGDSALHRKVLEQRIGELLRVQTTAEIAGVLDLVVGTTTLALVAPHFKEERAAALTFAVGYGAMDAVAIGSLFMTRDTRSRVFQVFIPATPGVASLGLALANDPGDIPKLTSGSLAAGWLLTTVLEGINDFSTPTRFSTLRAHQQRLENEEDLAGDERRTMHHDLLGARGPIPRWTIGAPLLIGGAVAISPAFSDRYSKDEKSWAAVLGGLSVLGGLFSLFPGIVTRYEEDLETLDISVALVPGGVSARGSFTAL